MAGIKLSAKELLDIIPKDSNRTVVFCEVEKNAYEVFFYSFFQDGKYLQSNELVDQDQIAASALEEAVEKLVEEVRLSSFYNSEKRNVVSANIEDNSMTWSLEQYEKTVGLYRIKKEWKTNKLR